MISKSQMSQTHAAKRMGARLPSIEPKEGAQASKLPEVQNAKPSDLLSHASRLSQVSKMIASRRAGDKDDLSAIKSRRGSSMVLDDIQKMRQKASTNLGMYSQNDEKDLQKKQRKKEDNLSV